MSTTTNNTIINTNTTSTSRRTKGKASKPVKQTLAEFQAQTESPVVETVEQVQESVTVAEPETATTTVETPIEQPNNKPVTNIWVERRKKALIEAIQAKEEELRLIEQKTTFKSNVPAQPRPQHPAQILFAQSRPNQSHESELDGGFVKVAPKSKTFRKNQPQHQTNQPNDESELDGSFVKVGPYRKPLRKTQTQTQYQGKSKYQSKSQYQDKGQYQGKPRYEPTEEQKAARALKADALEIARNQMIDYCV